MTTQLTPPTACTVTLPATRRRVPESISLAAWDGTTGHLTFDGRRIASVIYTGAALHVQYDDVFDIAEQGAFRDWCTEVDADCGIAPAGPDSSPYGEEVCEYFGMTNWWPDKCDVPTPVAHLIISLAAEITAAKDLDRRTASGAAVYTGPGLSPNWITARGLSVHRPGDIDLLGKVVPQAMYVWRDGAAQLVHPGDRRSDSGIGQ